MSWRKLGQVFDPREHRPWARSHAQVPTPLVRPDVIRIYYADRDEQGRSFPTFLDVDREQPTRVVYLHKRPVLERGAPGFFDDDGVMPSCLVEQRGQLWLYYTGWNRRVTVGYHNATGLAVSDDGGLTFRRLFDGPVLDRLPLEPSINVTPWVLREGERWRAWYSSGVRWLVVGGRPEPVYVLRQAESSDGVHWQRSGEVCVPPASEGEAFNHPTVIRRGDRYCMWYCVRESEDYRDGPGAYRIGYAESADGVRFQRLDERAGIALSPRGWDSTMLCYPSLAEVGERLYLFYNGNGFGQTGFGVAVWEGEAHGSRPTASG